MEADSGRTDPFSTSRERVEELLGFLGGEQAAQTTAAELEDRLRADGRELICTMLKDHLDLRALKETRIEEVKDAVGIPRGSVETSHTRPLVTVFGEVSVERFVYRHRGEHNLYPADAQLNLPEELHSHGLRELAAIEASRGFAWCARLDLSIFELKRGHLELWARSLEERRLGRSTRPGRSCWTHTPARNTPSVNCSPTSPALVGRGRRANFVAEGASSLGNRCATRQRFGFVIDGRVGHQPVDRQAAGNLMAGPGRRSRAGPAGLG